MVAWVEVVLCGVSWLVEGSQGGRARARARSPAVWPVGSDSTWPDPQKTANVDHTHTSSLERALSISARRCSLYLSCSAWPH